MALHQESNVLVIVVWDTEESSYKNIVQCAAFSQNGDR
jgi:hypothetical protein